MLGKCGPQQYQFEDGKCRKRYLDRSTAAWHFETLRLVCDVADRRNDDEAPQEARVQEAAGAIAEEVEVVAAVEVVAGEVAIVVEIAIATAAVAAAESAESLDQIHCSQLEYNGEVQCHVIQRWPEGSLEQSLR